MLFITLNTISALAATDSELLKACDAALEAKKQEASLCGLGVKLRDNEIERVSKENANLRERDGEWFRNPFIWATIGVLVGAYAGARVTR